MHCSQPEKTKKNRVDELARHTGEEARVHSRLSLGEQYCSLFNSSFCFSLLVRDYSQGKLRHTKKVQYKFFFFI